MTAQAPAGFFSGTNGLDASSKLPFMPPNFDGEVQIDVCKGNTSERAGRAYIVEFSILTSNLANLPPLDASYVAVGSRRSWYVSMKEPGTAYPNCISFLYAALGLIPQRDQAKIDAEVKPKQDAWLNASISSANPFAKVNVHLTTSEKKMKKAATLTIEEARKANAVYTVHNWAPTRGVAAPAATA